MIKNINDLKRIYYNNYPIEQQYMLLNPQNEPIKMIQPLSPFNHNQKNKIPYDTRKMEHRNTIESDANASLSSSAESMKAKERQKFKAYQNELMQQIEEKRRRIAIEKEHARRLDSYYIKQRQYKESESDIESEKVKRYLMKNNPYAVAANKEKDSQYNDIRMIRYYEELFQSLFKQQKSIIDEYRNEVNILKMELYRIRHINTNSTKNRNRNEANAIMNTPIYEEEEKYNKDITKNILYRSKYENKTSLQEHSNSNVLLPTKSKLVKKIGSKHLIETWVNNDNDYNNQYDQINIFTTLPNENDNDNEQSKENNHQIMNSIDTHNDNYCYPQYYIEKSYTIPKKHHKDYNLTNSLSLNNDPIPETKPIIKTDSKSAMRYLNSNLTQSNADASLSESTYYNPNLPPIDINQIIDFSRNDSSNIDTDSDNLHSNFIEHQQQVSPLPLTFKHKDSFKTKITYFDNNSQIISSCKHNSSNSDGDGNNNEERLSTVYNPLNTESNENEFFNTSLNTFNEHMLKEDSTLKRIQAYTMNINGTSSSASNFN